MNDRPDYIRDTIVATATPPGKGGIGIVRVSGPMTEEVARKVLGRVPEPRVATNAHFRNDAQESIDTGLALYFPAPASFTGESVLELHGHGGPVVNDMLVDAVVSAGARMAEAGEFSQRAYLNGKLDLVQAEAIADLIDSGTRQAARAAHRSLAGVFSAAVAALAEQLIRLRLHVEAAIDFPEEEIDFLSDRALLKQLDACRGAFTSLLQNAASGMALRDGLQFVIAGRPNAGKSSLLNALSGEEAAIVTNIAGTTRDLIRAHIDIDGLLVEIVDTAGIRNEPDAIEAEGIRRTQSAMSTADAVLWIHDATEAGVKQDLAALPDGLPVILINNKTDLTTLRPGRAGENPATVNVSARTGAGLTVLKELIHEIAGYETSGEGAFTARRRHVLALQEAQDHFITGLQALNETGAGELLAEELRLAHQSITTITGEFSSDDLLGRIFSAFCIGK